MATYDSIYISVCIVVPFRPGFYTDHLVPYTHVFTHKNIELPDSSFIIVQCVFKQVSTSVRDQLYHHTSRAFVITKER